MLSKDKHNKLGRADHDKGMSHAGGRSEDNSRGVRTSRQTSLRDLAAFGLPCCTALPECRFGPYTHEGTAQPARALHQGTADCA